MSDLVDKVLWPLNNSYVPGSSPVSFPQPIHFNYFDDLSIKFGAMIVFDIVVNKNCFM